MTILVVEATDDRKMVSQLLFNVSLVKGIGNFFGMRNSCVFKHVIKFTEPTLKFLRKEFEVYRNKIENQMMTPNLKEKYEQTEKVFTLVPFSIKPNENEINRHREIDSINFHKL